MSEFADVLNDLIQIARDGCRFYEQARDKVEDPEALAAIDEMLRVRIALIDGLSAMVAARGEAPAVGGTLVGKMQQTYAEVLARLFENSDQIYVDQLEEAEDRLLAHFERALERVASEAARAVIARYLPLARAAHERMRALKHRDEPLAPVR